MGHLDLKPEIEKKNNYHSGVEGNSLTSYCTRVPFHNGDKQSQIHYPRKQITKSQHDYKKEVPDYWNRHLAIGTYQF